MVKTRTLYAVCKMCNKQLTIEVPEDLAKDRKYYPFEYIHIHGSPEHALMLFLDKELRVRETIAYSDITVVKKKGREYKNLIRMSEIDSLAAIYADPVRLALYNLLTEGPYAEGDLIDKLKGKYDIIEGEFHLLVLPLIRTGLVTTAWLQDSYQMGYFLIKDFAALRIPTKITAHLFKKKDEFKPYANSYFSRVNEVLAAYHERFLSGTKNMVDDMHLTLKIRSELKYFWIYNSLWTGPLPETEILKESDEKAVEFLLNKDFIMQISINSEKYYALLTEIFIEKFPPKYIMNQLVEKLKTKEITQELAISHLNLLYSADLKQSS